MERISPQEAKRLIEEEGVRLIDVREQDEWDTARIPGAQLVPLSEYSQDETMLAPAARTIFQCGGGTRSVTAAEMYETVFPETQTYNLEGGISGWAAEGLPIENGKEQ